MLERNPIIRWLFWTLLNAVIARSSLFIFFFHLTPFIISDSYVTLKRRKFCSGTVNILINFLYLTTTAAGIVKLLRCWLPIGDVGNNMRWATYRPLLDPLDTTVYVHTLTQTYHLYRPLRCNTLVITAERKHSKLVSGQYRTASLLFPTGLVFSLKPVVYERQITSQQPVFQSLLASTKLHGSKSSLKICFQCL